MSDEHSTAARTFPREIRWWAVLLGVWLLFQVGMLYARWVNPDEGAHLMDAYLLSLGLIPHVDFDARQPLYTLLYLPFVQAGLGLVAARLVPLLCTLATAPALYKVGRSLGMSRNEATLAAALYLFSPTVLISATVVKTEPPVILFSTLAFLCLARYRNEPKPGWLLLAGILSASGFYIRESALAVALACLFLALLWSASRARAVLALSAGFCSVCAAVAWPFRQVLGPREWLLSANFNPGSAVAKALARLVGWTGSEAVRASDQPWGWTQVQILEPAVLNVVLILAAVGFAARHRQPLVQLAILWLGWLALLYGYFTLHRGFYQFYFREFLPPLCLLAAPALVGPRMPHRLAALAGLVLGIHLVAPPVSRGPLLQYALACLIVAGSVGLLVGRWAGLIRGSLLVSVIYAGFLLGPRYDCSYPMTTVDQVSAVVAKHSEPSERVLSGSVIWEFQARRRPFADWSHPLSFRARTTPEEVRVWWTAFLQDPPAVVVLDRVAEDTFYPRFPELEPRLKTDYSEVQTIAGITILRRVEPSVLGVPGQGRKPALVP